MPNTKSALKAMRSSLRRFENNRGIRARLKTLEKAFLTDVEAKNAEEASNSLNKVISAYDKAAKTNVIHWAKADRKKSRLMKRLQGMTSEAGASS